MTGPHLTLLTFPRPRQIFSRTFFITFK